MFGRWQVRGGGVSTMPGLGQAARDVDDVWAVAGERRGGLHHIHTSSHDVHTSLTGGSIAQPGEGGYYFQHPPSNYSHPGCMSQDVLPTLLAEGVKLDGIFWDTYAEYYADMREFHEAVRCGGYGRRSVWGSDRRRNR